MTDTVRLENALRKGFKYLNLYMVLLWRLGLGKYLNAGPQQLGRYIVLVHTGRKTGRRRYTPVNYAAADGKLYCTAGFGSKCDWYQNIMASQSVEVWLPDGRWLARVHEIDPTEPNRNWLMRQVLIGSGFAAILAGLDPRSASEEVLARQSQDYRLLCLERQRDLTGPGGPGELAWVWPVAAAGLIFLAWLRSAQKKKLPRPEFE